MPEAPRFVDHGRVESTQLRHVAPDVDAVRIEPVSLARRAEYSVRVRARPASGHPLPVQVVERDVSVDEVFEECRAPSRQSSPRFRLRNDAAIIRARVRKETFERQLPHPCVDDRHAGEAAAPCRRNPSGPYGADSPIDVVGPRCFRSRRLRPIPPVALAELQVFPSEWCKAGTPNATTTGADSELGSPDSTQCSTTDRNGVCQRPHPDQ